MNTIHVVCGDIAAQQLRAAMALAQRADPVLVLRDDLAIGPLREIDESERQRAAFWQRVMPSAGRDYAGELREELASLQRLAEGDNAVVCWHGDSASDQLSLRRVAFMLRNTPARLNEIALRGSDLGGAHAAGHAGDANRRTSVGMYAPEMLAKRFARIAPISLLRIGRLSLEWRALKQVNTQVRRWVHNTFEGATFAEIDDQILTRAPVAWTPVAAFLGELMPRIEGFFATDSFLLWRCRELGAAGRLALRGDTTAAAACDLRLE
ncbi:hypothetical protein AB870_10125 [Pandoraea faecigallinarum]|uniref:Uncharacterized protein n=1 Tax=Pandoraea faecigallinarum TaxID=656179 RepID=A0A0H3WRE1_9BURK|nr:DUF1835 domain-containing protein [Pandoraea faecigallinarum]AKM30387.1 hypothetical protein AB870_10125 [Pandoraea faecigallinarum]